jgi:methyl-accepting chemotaxis protein
MEQINQALSQFDIVTQQNGGGLRGDGLMSEELSRQAELLRATMSFFRTVEGGEAREAHSVSASPAPANLRLTAGDMELA